jgi:molecular chaperone DnaK
MAKLNEAWTAASQEMYNAMNQDGGAQPGAGTNPGASAGEQGAGTGETVTDAEFEEVK